MRSLRSIGLGLALALASCFALAQPYYQSDVVTARIQFRGANGSASVPAYSFTADPDTGIYSGGANVICVGTAGVSRLCISSAGLQLMGSSSGSTTLKAAAAAGTTTITLPAGTTDFSATGGTSQVVKQTSSGGPFTVGAVGVSDIASFGTGVATALGVNVGTAGSIVVNGGALGTPSSGVGTNITNVNAATLGGATFAAPGAIGGGTPAAITGTAVAATTTLAVATSDTKVYSAANGSTINWISFASNSASSTTGHNVFVQWNTGSGNPASSGVVQNGSGYGDFVWNSYTGAYAETMRLSSAGVLAVTTETTSPLFTTTATSSTGTAVIIDGSNRIRPLTSRESDKANIQRNWQPDEKKEAAFLALSPITFDYRDYTSSVVMQEREVIDPRTKAIARQMVPVKVGEDRPGVKGVLGFSADEIHAAGLPELINYDDKGQPLSLREHAILAYHHALIQKLEARITALEAR